MRRRRATVRGASGGAENVIGKQAEPRCARAAVDKREEREENDGSRLGGKWVEKMEVGGERSGLWEGFFVVEL